MTRGRIDPVPQRELAQRLRYWIDRGEPEAVAALIASNPHNSRSSHVIHNLGVERMAWLDQQGFNMKPGDPA